jgi:hypothetical protein
VSLCGVLLCVIVLDIFMLSAAVLSLVVLGGIMSIAVVPSIFNNFCKTFLVSKLFVLQKQPRYGS